MADIRSRPDRRKLLGTTALALTCLSLLGAAGAQADSIVYVYDDNIWLVNPDGSGDYQVTTDGTDSRSYWSPSQADDGTIVAVRDASPADKLVRMKQNGEVLSEFTPTVRAENALNRIYDAAVSPDGTKVAYVTGWAGDGSCNFGANGTTNCYVFAVSPSTGPGNLGSQPFRDHPSWMNNSTLLVKTDFNRIDTYTLGSAGSVPWFGRDGTMNSGPGDSLFYSDITPAGDKIVTTALQAGTAQGFSSSVVTWTTNGAPPAQPSSRCRIGGAAGGKFSDPSWAPDGSAIAWEEGDLNQTNAPGADEGIWVIEGDVVAPACDQINGALLVPGGQEPDWGPAAINPGPRPQPATPPGSNNSTSTPGTNTNGTTSIPTNTTTVTPLDATPPEVTLAARRQKLGTVLKKGFVVGFDSNEGGSATGALVASGTAARGLKVTVAKSVSVATGKAKFAAPGQQRLVLKFTRKAKKKLARKRSLKLTLRLKVTDGAGNAKTKTQKVTLKK